MRKPNGFTDEPCHFQIGDRLRLSVNHEIAVWTVTGVRRDPLTIDDGLKDFVVWLSKPSWDQNLIMRQENLLVAVANCPTEPASKN